MLLFHIYPSILEVVALDSFVASFSALLATVVANACSRRQNLWLPCNHDSTEHVHPTLKQASAIHAIPPCCQAKALATAHSPILLHDPTQKKDRPCVSKQKYTHTLKLVEREREK